MWPKKITIIDTVRCLELIDGFSLWTEYLKDARSHISSLDTQAIEIKYEDFLVKPFNTLKRLAYFCGLKATDEDIERVSASANKERAYAYRKKPELQEFAEQMAEQLRLFEYS